MDKIQMILTALSSILGIIVTVVIPFAIKVYVSFKKSKAAITKADADKIAAEEAERKAAQMLEMTNKANEIIESLENKFASQNAILKQVNPTQTLGSVKKECALAEMSEYATVIGATFDREYWSKKIDEIVQMTSNVNSRTAA